MEAIPNSGHLIHMTRHLWQESPPAWTQEAYQTAAYQVLPPVGVSPPPRPGLMEGGGWGDLSWGEVPPQLEYPTWPGPTEGVDTWGGVPPVGYPLSGYPLVRSDGGGVDTRGGVPSPAGLGRGTPSPCLNLAGVPPADVDRQNHRRSDTCQNITFPRTTYVAGKNLIKLSFYLPASNLQTRNDHSPSLEKAWKCYHFWLE